MNFVDNKKFSHNKNSAFLKKYLSYQYCKYNEKQFQDFFNEYTTFSQKEHRVDFYAKQLCLSPQHPRAS